MKLKVKSKEELLRWFDENNWIEFDPDNFSNPEDNQEWFTDEMFDLCGKYVFVEESRYEFTWQAEGFCWKEEWFEPASQKTMKIKRLNENSILPVKHHTGDVAFDLFLSEECGIYSNETKMLSTGISVELPKGIGLRISSRSSIFFKYNCIIQGEIDNDYRGEIKILIYNLGSEPILFEKGQRIAQMIPFNIVDLEIEEIEEHQEPTSRGGEGFGSTGK